MDRFVAQSMFPKQSHSLEETVPRWAIFVEKIPSKEDEVHLVSRVTVHAFHCLTTTYVVFDCQLQNFFECIHGIRTTHRIPLQVTNVIVSCEEDLNDIV